MSQDQYTTSHSASASSSSSSSRNSPPIPSTPPNAPRTLVTPSPLFSRPPSDHPSTPQSRYPPIRSVHNTPQSQHRRQAATPPRIAHESPSTPGTLRRAVGTALPLSPPPSYQAPYTTPPSAFRGDLFEAVELRPITPRQDRLQTLHDSPFDDRHSVAYDAVDHLGGPIDEEDPFEFSEDGSGDRKKKTMPGYQFVSVSPTGKDWTMGSKELQFGGALQSSHATPRSSYYTQPIPYPTIQDHIDLHGPEVPDNEPTKRSLTEPIRPTFRGLFALSEKKDFLLYLLPAMACSIAGALVQPYMSMVIGDAFEVFVAYPLDNSLATAEDNAKLIAGVTTNTIKLAGVGAAAVVLNYGKGVFWQRHGEVVVNRLRQTVYEGVQNKSMEWFDLGMGMKNDEAGEDSETVGAGGLMAKFTRETDDVRAGMSQAFGLTVQNFFTFLFCFILAMMQSPILAMVTLSTIPIVVILQIVTQVAASPLYEQERRAFAEASTNVERATSAITTVKAHNAQQSELERFQRSVSRGVRAIVRSSMVWAISIGLTDFITLATFVLGFWYGAKMVRDGKISPGVVMTVFWACLLAASFLQMVIPQLTVVTKAKNSMASLRTVIRDDPKRPMSGNPFSPITSPDQATFTALPRSSVILKSKPPRPLSLRGIRPIRCRGEFNLQNVSFAYPSRPDQQVLRDVSLFIPPGETTFIVGGSGSGKSTVAQLLLRLYIPDGGEITLDEQSFRYLDDGFCKENIAAVQQGCILFDMTVHDNVAMGLAGAGQDLKTGVVRTPKDVTRMEVVEACKMAMIHDFIESLPQGYETKLGTGGSALSGGQRQRLAIARARIRDPTVLILDEATSALDATSRVAVFESMKAWRKNKTTIVITHDLSQVVATDFVYVMKNGIVAEQGFRSDLMKKTPMWGQPTGIFASLAAEQAIEPLPPKLEEWRDRPEDEEVLDQDDDDESILLPPNRRSMRPHTPSFGAQAGRPGSMLYLGVLDEYARGARLSVLDTDTRLSKRMSTSQNRLSWTPQQLDNRRNSRVSLAPGGLVVPSRPSSRMSRQHSSDNGHHVTRQSSFNSQPQINHLEKNGRASALSYRNRTLSQNLDDDMKGDSLEVITHPSPYDEPKQKLKGTVRLIIYYFPTLPQKYLLFIGLLGSVAHGISTPVWSYFLSKLMAIVGAGGTDPALTKFGLIVLALSGAQAFADWVQEYCLAAMGAKWTGKIRQDAFLKVLKQDKAWFDESQNSPARLVQSLIKDADDMRHLMGEVIGKFAVLIAMIGLGIIWAMVINWRLTLVGVALAPSFAIMIMLNEFLIGRAETVNKAKREALARTFYESISNIRGIRAMALESTFRNEFNDNASQAVSTGKRAAWVVALGVGLSAGMPLFAQALLNWVGSQFMIQGYLNYAEMLQVFNLVLFSLTFGTAMLDFIPILSKAKVAARDFGRYYALSEDTAESAGELRYPISGQITFDKIAFSYPTRPDVPILTDTSFSLSPGECVAIVGPSGSGKSTIAALIQRLYEPNSGRIQLGKYDLSKADPVWLRNHIAVVSQSANLFDASVTQNIAYGGGEVAFGEVVRAAKSANIHEFIQSLPNGYDTNLGENASLISGGQAQRLQIARALVRSSRILILDECTSALDVDNQRAILDTIVKIKENRTTIFITHSVEAMKRCGRVICLGDGVVAEQGSFDELVARGGVFAQLMRTGEWE